MKNSFVSSSMQYKNFVKDYELGLQGEIDILPIIKQYFNRHDIISTKDNFCPHDFEDSVYKYELKTRTNTYAKYATTLIGIDKLAESTIYLFNFTDGLYYLEYKKTLFDLFERQLFVRNDRQCGNRDVKKIYLFIPINQLIKI